MIQIVVKQCRKRAFKSANKIFILSGPRLNSNDLR